jgi:hypothetical protein
MAGQTPHQLAVALVTANLDFRIKADEQGLPSGAETQLPEYRLYVDLWDEAAMEEVEPADVLSEMTHLAGTASCGSLRIVATTRASCGRRSRLNLQDATRRTSQRSRPRLLG